MRLNNPLVTSIEFDGIELPIDLTFDNVLDVFDILESSDLFPEEKVNMCLGLLISDLEKFFQGSSGQQFLSFNHILGNYVSVGNSDGVETNHLGNPMPNAVKEKRTIGPVHDAKHVYALFRQVGIGLFEKQGRVMWEESQALLESSSDSTILARIIQIRTQEPSKGESAKEGERMRKLQQGYTLPDSEVGENDGRRESGDRS